MAKIVIVEDEVKIASLLSDYFSAAGHSVSLVHHGDEAVGTIDSQHPDIILLDLMLPGKDGISICQDVLQKADHWSQRPGIIMITARTEEVDRLLGLEIGADDYICKPFSPREVVARVTALLRRMQRLPGSNTSQAQVSVDESAFSVSINQQALHLTPTEFKLFALMYQSPGTIFSRARLVDALHDDFRDISDRAVDSHIKNLRKKLKAALPEQEIIRSVYGVGYKAELSE